jgi:MoaA/NifB/PqqE/SkfB family radical SAM enzyme|tara:strand:- start:66 stop:1097 length:1032 start_codon:yes stop_codon:yes gene_type:complete
MNITLDHWHIEVSSICTLKCPRCTRTEVPKTLLNRSLDLKFFQEQIGQEKISQIKKISFCGDDGDPIYAKQFLEIVTWIKSINPSIKLLIITNGSYKTEAWWKSLAYILNKHDEIHWSLDGWDQASNSKYRVNCDWASIITGLSTFVKYNQETYTVIATIAFRFNELGLTSIQNIAKAYSVDCWQLTKSTKFGSKYPDAYGGDDLLEPLDPNLVAEGYRFEREQTLLSNKVRPGADLKELFWKRAKALQASNEYPALCYIGNKGVFLKSTGEFYPCCWTALRYPHNKKWNDLAETKFNLYNNTLDEILQDEWWQTDFKKFDNLECQTKCIKSKLSDKAHVTEW